MEKETRKQSSSNAWFLHRAGRITASNMKAAERTHFSMILNSLCTLSYTSFIYFLTQMGMYTKTHEGLDIAQAGLFVDAQQPYVGASPDGIVKCSCCSKGVLEVKSPLRVKDGLPEEDSMENDGQIWTLKRDHSYFYQVQHRCMYEK